MNKQEKAYVAGIVDGEGHIGAYCLLLTKTTLSDDYQFYLHVRNTNKILVHYLKKITGLGSISLRKIDNIKHKDVYTWRTSARDTKKLLLQIGPFLIIKIKQAKIMLKFRDTYPPKQRGRTPVPAKLRNQRRKLYLELRNLNRRGKPNAR